MAKHVFGDLDNKPDVVEPGIYSGTVTWAEMRYIKNGKWAGNEMLALGFELDGSKAMVFDNILFIEPAAFRIDTFLKACKKQPEKGQEVDLTPESVIGWRCWLNVGIEKSDNEKYPDKNKVLQYVTNHKEQVPAVKDDIPF